MVKALTVRRMRQYFLLEILDWNLVVCLHDPRKNLGLLLQKLLFLLRNLYVLFAWRVNHMIANRLTGRFSSKPLHHKRYLLVSRRRIRVAINCFTFYIKLDLCIYAVWLNQVLPIILNNLLLKLLLAHWGTQLLRLIWNHWMLMVQHVSLLWLQRRLYTRFALLVLL